MKVFRSVNFWFFCLAVGWLVYRSTNQEFSFEMFLHGICVLVFAINMAKEHIIEEIQELKNQIKKEN